MTRDKDRDLIHTRPTFAAGVFMRRGWGIVGRVPGPLQVSGHVGPCERDAAVCARLVVAYAFQLD